MTELSRKYDFRFDFHFFDYSCDYFTIIGSMMDADGLKKLSDCDAILLGAVGMPNVPDHISLWGFLIAIRKAFEQYVNLRPVKRLKGIPSIFKVNKEIDYLIVRENAEGEYSDVGGIIHQGQEDEREEQQSVFTKKGTERLIKYAYEWDLFFKNSAGTFLKKIN